MTHKATPDFLGRVGRYYAEKLGSHGATARGVDWSSQESQELRFAQFESLLGDDPYSINDIGCGYGQLLSFLEGRGAGFDYLGVDVSQAMIDAAWARFGKPAHARFICGSVPDRIADYSVASGIFNVRLDVPDDAWLDYMLATIAAMDSHSARGFAFNCLTSYSDADRKRPDLYYADPCMLFDHCKSRYSRNVALLHDYGLYEFTMIVRKGD